MLAESVLAESVLAEQVGADVDEVAAHVLARGVRVALGEGGDDLGVARS